MLHFHEVFLKYFIQLQNFIDERIDENKDDLSVSNEILDVARKN